MPELLPIRAPYLGHAATRSLICNTGNAGLTRSMTRSFHIAREKLVNPTAVFPNWRLNSGAEAAGYSGSTIKVALEYPIGGTPILANECIAAGNAAVAHPIGNTVLTFNVTVPRGAPFYFRTYVVGPNGVVWSALIGGNQSQWGNEPGEFCDIGTSDNDKVMSGSGSPAGALYTPIVIATQKRSPSVVILGDSRPAGGAGNNYPQKNFDAGPEAKILGPIYGYSNCAQSATLQSQWNGSVHTYFNQLLAAGYFTHLINAYGTNDIGGGASAATITTARATCAANLKAAKSDLVIIGETIYPYIGSSDVFVNKANMTLGTNQPRVFTLNDNIRNGIAGEDYVWDISDAIDPFREGTYPVSRDVSLASRTPASVTGSISGTTLTVTAVGTGALKSMDWLYDAGLNIKDSTYIIEQLTGTTGGIGTYRINRQYTGSFPYPAVVASTTITTAGITTRDGLHLQSAGEDLVIERKGADLLAKISA